jgi:adenylate kinase
MAARLSEARASVKRARAEFAPPADRAIPRRHRNVSGLFLSPLSLRQRKWKPLGQEVASYIDKGNLVPFNIIINVVESIVHATPAHQKILFDGIPRDLDQMKEFDRIMRECGREFQAVQMSLAKETAIERLQKRALAEGRLDDMHIEYIERRIGIFMEKTMRVVDAYREAGNMTVINALGTTDEVFQRLAAAVGDATLVA